MIPYGRQCIDDEDVASVVEVLGSEFLTQGPVVENFERTVATRVGAAHGVAVNSATSALHIACMALGLGPGDLLWTAPNTFVASANCAFYCGAVVDFVDIDPRTYCMSADALEEKLTVASRAGRLPKIIVAVHFAGQSCEMARIGELARRHGVRLIEDASHALGAFYRGHPVGDCHWSDICVFSFHPVKIVTTGEGGLAVTQSTSLARVMRLLRNHGITRERSEMTSDDGPWYYEQLMLGWNYRLTDMAAALGMSQIQKLEEFVDARRSHAAVYDAELSSLNLLRPHQHPDTSSSWHLYVIQVDRECHLDIFQGLLRRGIGVNLHYMPVHLQPWYRGKGFCRGDFPVSENYYERAISLPIFPSLTADERAQVITAVAAEVR